MIFPNEQEQTRQQAEQQNHGWYDWLEIPLEFFSEFGLDVIMEFLTGLFNI